LAGNKLKHSQVCFSLISHAENSTVVKCKNLSTTVLKVLGKNLNKNYDSKDLNGQCPVLLLALDGELGWPDIQLDLAGIQPDCGTNKVCFHEMRQIHGNLKSYVMWKFELEDRYSLFQYNTLSSKA